MGVFISNDPILIQMRFELMGNFVEAEAPGGRAPSKVQYVDWVRQEKGNIIYPAEFVFQSGEHLFIDMDMRDGLPSVYEFRNFDGDRFTFTEEEVRTFPGYKDIKERGIRMDGCRSISFSDLASAELIPMGHNNAEVNSLTMKDGTVLKLGGQTSSTTGNEEFVNKEKKVFIDFSERDKNLLPGYKEITTSWAKRLYEIEMETAAAADAGNRAKTFAPGYECISQREKKLIFTEGYMQRHKYLPLASGCNLLENTYTFSVPVSSVTSRALAHAAKNRELPTDGTIKFTLKEDTVRHEIETHLLSAYLKNGKMPETASPDMEHHEQLLAPVLTNYDTEEKIRKNIIIPEIRERMHTVRKAFREMRGILSMPGKGNERMLEDLDSLEQVLRLRAPEIRSIAAQIKARNKRDEEWLSR